MNHMEIKFMICYIIQSTQITDKGTTVTRYYSELKEMVK